MDNTCSFWIASNQTYIKTENTACETDQVFSFVCLFVQVGIKVMSRRTLLILQALRSSFSPE